MIFHSAWKQIINLEKSWNNKIHNISVSKLYGFGSTEELLLRLNTTHFTEKIPAYTPFSITNWQS